MKEYEGAVLFVDILGTGELTSGESIEITQADYCAIGQTSQASHSNQTFCAVLLSLFRRHLKSIRQPGLRMAQLSDCAFIWSKNPNLVLTAASRLMWKSVTSGLLCRGGLSFGEIVEPNKTDRQIGHFVCGDAVTRAVQLERHGKGARIFADTRVPGLVGLDFCPDAFSALRNASDYGIIDEFKWFTYHVDAAEGPDTEKAAAAINKMIRLIAMLWHSPRFRWNASVTAGKIQIGSTIERISEEILYLDKIYSLKLGKRYYWASEIFLEAPNNLRNRKAVEALVKNDSVRL